MREPVSAYIGLGANLGNPVRAVRQAMRDIARIPGTQLAAQSSLYRSKPVDAGGPDFINAVVEVATTLSAPELLRELQRIEREAGRERPYRNAPRTLDLDLLLYGSGRIDSAELTLPHPRAHERAFVLVPLAEIAPQRVQPSQLAHITSQVIARITPPADH
jgi:2-amino-4-hydroxy-6-hydroxymethyldihydropteridine diphosphokinase